VGICYHAILARADTCQFWWAAAAFLKSVKARFLKLNISFWKGIVHLRYSEKIDRDKHTLRVTNSKVFISLFTELLDRRCLRKRFAEK